MFAYHTQKLFRYRITLRGGSLSDDKIKMYADTMAVYQKLAARPDLTPEETLFVDEAIRKQSAEFDFYRGKPALYRKNRSEALLYLESANKIKRNMRLTIAILLLRFCPRLMYSYVYRNCQTEYTYLH